MSRYVLGRAVAAGAPRTESITGAVPFRDGDVLDVPGGPRAIHMPGHTAGECMLYLEDRQVLLSGDAIVTLDLLRGADVAPRVPYRLVNDDDLAARRSIARLGELGTFSMLPGHGRPWRGTVEQVIEAADVARLRPVAGIGT